MKLRGERMAFAAVGLAVLASMLVAGASGCQAPR
jgi:hypothetical protein